METLMFLMWILQSCLLLQEPNNLWAEVIGLSMNIWMDWLTILEFMVVRYQRIRFRNFIKCQDLMQMEMALPMQMKSRQGLIQAPVPVSQSSQMVCSYGILWTAILQTCLVMLVMQPWVMPMVLLQALWMVKFSKHWILMGWMTFSVFLMIVG